MTKKRNEWSLIVKWMTHLYIVKWRIPSTYVW